MELWNNPNDGLAFEAALKLEDDREPITAETPAAFPCGKAWPGKPVEEKLRDLSGRLAHEQQTVQRLVRLLDEAGHDAARWRTRCVTRLGLAYVIGAVCGAAVAAAIAWWAL